MEEENIRRAIKWIFIICWHELEVNATLLEDDPVTQQWRKILPARRTLDQYLVFHFMKPWPKVCIYGTSEELSVSFSKGSQVRMRLKD